MTILSDPKKQPFETKDQKKDEKVGLKEHAPRRTTIEDIWVCSHFVLIILKRIWRAEMCVLDLFSTDQNCDY